MPTAADRTPRPDTRGPVIAAGASLVFFLVAIRRAAALHAGASDLGIFDQAVWLMSRGRAPFVTTIGIDVFADHVSPVLLAFVPLYRIVATPWWLLAAQAACLGLTVVPARHLADSWGVPRRWATLLVLSNPFVWSAAVYDIHPVVFATPAVAWLLLAVRRDDRRAATVAGVLIMLCRADTSVVLAGAALLARGPTRRRLLWMVPIPLVVAQVVPHVLGTWQTFERYYGRLGSSPADALAHPWRIVLLVPTATIQLASWLLPVGFLPLRRPRWVLALGVAGLPLLLSSWPGISQPWWHHGVVLVPFVVAGTLAALSTEHRSDGPAPARGSDRARVAVGAVAALACLSPFAPWAPPRVRMTEILTSAPPAIRRAVDAIGPSESVSTSNEIAAALAHRDHVYIYPCPFPEAPGTRRCTHPDLYSDADRVDVVVLPGRVDLGGLSGHWRVHRAEGFTIARRTR